VPVSPYTLRLAEASVTRYQKRLSGPILDRIDTYLTIPRVDFADWMDQIRGDAYIPPPGCTLANRRERLRLQRTPTAK